MFILEQMECIYLTWFIIAGNFWISTTTSEKKICKKCVRVLPSGIAQTTLCFRYLTTSVCLPIIKMKTAIFASLVASAAAFAPGAKVAFNTQLAAQDFLEAEPYYDQSNVPVNVYKNKAPSLERSFPPSVSLDPRPPERLATLLLTTTVTSLTGRDNPGELSHQVFVRRTESPTLLVFTPLPLLVTETI